MHKTFVCTGYGKLQIIARESTLQNSGVSLQKKKKDTQTLAILSKIITNLVLKIFKNKKDCSNQGYNARKVNCGRVYSAYILNPVLFGRNL